jgi:hypothetical protein
MEIYPDVDVNLKKKLTPKSLKVLGELGLLNQSEKLTQEELNFLKKTLEEIAMDERNIEDIRKCREIVDRNPSINEIEIYMNEKKLLSLIEAIYELTEEQKEKLKDWENIDVEKVIDGAFEYMGKLVPSSLRSASGLMNLQNLMREVRTGVN